MRQTVSSPRLIQAPRIEAARNAATVSSEISGILIVEVPDASAAIKIARIVWDLEPGISTCPEILDFLTDISIRTTFHSDNQIII